MTSGDTSVRAELAAEPRSVRTARRTVGAALVGWGLEPLEDTAVLLVSELATNVVLHARTAYVVEVERRSDVVRVSVSDAAAHGPARRRHGVSAGTGRGIALVATLSTDWGSDPADRPWAKTVWFELPLDAADLPAPTEGALLR